MSDGLTAKTADRHYPSYCRIILGGPRPLDSGSVKLSPISRRWPEPGTPPKSPLPGWVGLPGFS